MRNPNFDLEKSVKNSQAIQKISKTLDYSYRTKFKSLSFEKIIEDPVSPTIKLFQNNLKYEKFLLEASKLDFCPIGCNENIPGNYANYLSNTLSHIKKIKNLKFNYALESPLLYDNFPIDKIERIAMGTKKILLLDLDETLIHADFNEEFLNDENIKYDAIISFCSEISNSKNNNKNDNNESNKIDYENKDYSNEKILNNVGIFLRPGVHNFLIETSKYFEIGIFTASVPEYANAVIDYLDPDKKYIKFRLYRNNCIM